MSILVINCGSSSIKYRLFADDERTLAGGLIERIGEAACRITTWHAASPDKTQQPLDARDHQQAFAPLFAALHDAQRATNATPLSAIGHRVVHGGERFAAPCLVDEPVLAAIRALIPLAPLHNPANLLGIEICRDLLPDIPQVAVFDTAFHQSLPEHAFRYAIPEAWYREYGVRRYGFHGSSHCFVATRAAQWLQRPLSALKLISLHLGNGASVCAIDGGRSIDTSMGFTPLAGLVMGSRCGDLDPAVPLYLQQRTGLSATDVDRSLNHQSGLKGLCDDNDLRTILARAQAGDTAAQRALDIYCYRIRHYIGAYAVALGRVDALIFTGGVGENAPEIRERCVVNLQLLGIHHDALANRQPLADGVLSFTASASTVQLLAIATDEELQIARDTRAILRAP